MPAMPKQCCLYLEIAYDFGLKYHEKRGKNMKYLFQSSECLPQKPAGIWCILVLHGRFGIAHEAVKEVCIEGSRRGSVRCQIGSF